MIKKMHTELQLISDRLYHIKKSRIFQKFWHLSKPSKCTLQSFIFKKTDRSVVLVLPMYNILSISINKIPSIYINYIPKHEISDVVKNTYKSNLLSSFQPQNHFEKFIKHVWQTRKYNNTYFIGIRHNTIKSQKLKESLSSYIISWDFGIKENNTNPYTYTFLNSIVNYLSDLYQNPISNLSY